MQQSSSFPSLKKLLFDQLCEITEKTDRAQATHMSAKS